MHLHWFQNYVSLYHYRHGDLMVWFLVVLEVNWLVYKKSCNYGLIRLVASALLPFSFSAPDRMPLKDCMAGSWGASDVHPFCHTDIRILKTASQRRGFWTSQQVIPVWKDWPYQNHISCDLVNHRYELNGIKLYRQCTGAFLRCQALRSRFWCIELMKDRTNLIRRRFCSPL